MAKLNDKLTKAFKGRQVIPGSVDWCDPKKDLMFPHIKLPRRKNICVTTIEPKAGPDCGKVRLCVFLYLDSKDKIVSVNTEIHGIVPDGYVVVDVPFEERHAERAADLKQKKIDKDMPLFFYFLIFCLHLTAY